MISEKIVRAIEKEGEKKGFYMESAGGYWEDGQVKFKIILTRRYTDPDPDIHVRNSVNIVDRVD
jgi:hypothetical protein